MMASQSKESLLLCVAAGIPACRRAGLPSPAEKTSRISWRVGKFVSGGNRGRFAGRQGCTPSTATKDGRRYNY